MPPLERRSELLLFSLGGDHTIVSSLVPDDTIPSCLQVLSQVLPVLRSLFKVYGPISVIHFDAHLVHIEVSEQIH